MGGVPDLGAVPALQNFALLIERPDLTVALHPPMTPELCPDVCDDRLQAKKNGDPLSEERRSPFQELIVWIRLS